MDKDETILDELINFEQKKPSQIPQILDDYLMDVAKNGEIIYPWKQIQPLFTRKLQLVLEDFHEQCPTENLPPSPNVDTFKYEVMKDKLVEATYSFNSAPFTIQRLCELLTSPNKHYKQTDKFMRGIEKNMLVVSSSSRRSSQSYECIPIMLNGTVETHNSSTENGSPSSVQLDSFATAFTPTTDRMQHSLSNHNHLFNNVESTKLESNGNDSSSPPAQQHDDVSSDDVPTNERTNSDDQSPSSVKTSVSVTNIVIDSQSDDQNVESSTPPVEPMICDDSSSSLTLPADIKEEIKNGMEDDEKEEDSKSNCAIESHVKSSSPVEQEKETTDLEKFKLEADSNDVELKVTEPVVNEPSEEAQVSKQNLKKEEEVPEHTSDVDSTINEENIEGKENA